MQVGDKFPSGVTFKYIPIDVNESPLACRVPILLKIDDELAKLPKGNIAIIAVPGAFTPLCTENHIPPFLANLNQLKSEQNIEKIIILSANDPFVLSAWSKLLIQQFGAGPDVEQKLIFASDPNAEFTQRYGLSMDASANGMGIRTKRFAMVLGSDRTIKYLGVEQVRGVSVSGFDAVLKAKL